MFIYLLYDNIYNENDFKACSLPLVGNNTSKATPESTNFYGGLKTKKKLI
jgi:hypothetical protein